ncbi:TIR domain-containing protein [Amycolatopsis sp. OK19-0408]|uniref:TIR domain-containing protein n=1 Tax=Amycolatopsis iheyensis TaxID=2945988 RepID=A0A9X2NDJ7_9PSEU|nr:TIR domain-containing protein [Amycolatopsis iheyensis]MCR6482565.1 TIR domain-containing protein [Amycolatopsis iheyensis]
MSGIFISFRGHDGDNDAWGLDTALVREFGEERVFRSGRSIEAGAEFPPVLLEGVRTASVMLVLIGAGWLDVAVDGRRRLDDPEDWVRREVAEALKLDKQVIPVLFRDARLPAEADLPPDIAGLALRQQFRVDPKTAGEDLDRLIKKLIKIDPTLGIGVVEGLEDLQKWLEAWRQFTNPPLPENLSLLGRESEAMRLCSWLDGPPSVLAVHAPGRTEAAAFVATAVRTHRPGTRAALVSGLSGWRHSRRLTGPHLLVVDSVEVEVGAADATHGHVVVVAQTPDPTGSELLALPRIPRDEAVRAFVASGVPLAEANRYAPIARRSISSLRRKLSPSAAEPAWASPPDSALVALLVLVGRWQAGSAADRAEIAAITGRDIEELDDFLGRAGIGGDPFLHRSGSRWQLADPQDAWSLLRRLLSAQDLVRWHESAFRVLSEPDPALALPSDQRTFAGLHGHVRKWSADLRHGLAQGAALLGAAGAARMADDRSGADHALAVVRAVLAKANDDSEGTLWRSLPDVLPLFAEAAPRAFLDAVDQALSGEALAMRSLFAAEDSGWSSFTPHVWLLWALESLCWSAEHLSMVVSVLAGLARIDPGEGTSTRPLESLVTLLQPWYPYLDLPAGRRSELVRAVCHRTPDVGWSLVVSLLRGRSGHLLASPRHPEVRLDWTVPEPPVTADDFAAFHDDLVDMAVGALEEVPQRWKELVEELPELTSPQWDRMVTALAAVTVERLSEEERFELWNVLTAAIAQHRYYSDAEWSLSEELLGRLEACAATIEPDVNPRRHARLFGWHPSLPGIDPFDYESHKAELERLRLDAVRRVLREYAVPGLTELARASEVPRLVGQAAAEVGGDDIQQDALALLGEETWVLGWIDTIARALGEEWTGATAKALGSEPALADFLLAVPVEQALALLASAGEETVKAFWSRTGFLPLPAGQEEFFLRQLLSHRRPWAAITSAALALHGGDAIPLPVSLVEEALALGLQTEVDHPDQHAIHQVGPLLDFLIRADADDRTVARFELYYHSALKHNRKPRVLYRVLTTDPAAYVDLYCEAHPAEDANPSPARIPAWFAIFEMRAVPGHTEAGLDSVVLKNWVSRARALFAERGRGKSGDRSIGTVLAGSPSGTDGAWPAEAVRDVLDVPDGLHLRRGFATGMVNNRGLTSRDSYEGGQQERDLAGQYREWARRIDVGWPRVAAVLIEYAEDLERDGIRNDGQADQVHDAP